MSQQTRLVDLAQAIGEDVKALSSTTAVPGPEGPAGHTGPRGPQGPRGPGINWRGALQTSTGPDVEVIVYDPNDAVEYSGSSYVIRQPVTGLDVLPGVTEGWEAFYALMADKGDLGDVGPAGPMGPGGPRGPQGSQGPIGPAGGPKGDTGPQGAQGVQGVPGIAGSYADWLAQGNAGTYADFLNAIRGPQGEPGEPGHDGSPGPAGQQGIPGDRGPQGDPGDPGGPCGPQGDAGPAGPKGDKGDTGASGTYEDWLAQGNVGSYDDFLDIITGPQGEPGVRGDQGPQGIPGSPGAPGLPGSAVGKGDKGDPGEKGDPGIVWLGPWDPDVYYSPSAGVNYTGSSWVNVAQGESRNETPGYSGDWELLAEHGEKGDPGGPPGPKGDQGDPGMDGAPGEPGPKGDKGDPGIAGTTGAQGPAGVAGLTWRAAWNAATAYAVNDAVAYNGSSYRRIVAGTTALSPNQDAVGLLTPGTPVVPTGGQGAGVTSSPYDLNGYLGTLGGVGGSGVGLVADGTNFKITASGVAGSTWPVSAIIDKNDSAFMSGSAGHSAANPPTLVYDFKARKLVVTELHMILSSAYNPGSQAPSGVALDGSDDGSTWTQLATGVYTWPNWLRMVFANTTPYRYLRVRATTVAGSGNWEIGLSEIEFFGTPYAIAVNPHWELIAAKGDTGGPGPPGATGAQGPAGATGATGPQGPKGDKGDKGDTGATGSAGSLTGPAGGDLGGTYPNPTVPALSGISASLGSQGTRLSTVEGKAIPAGGAIGQTLVKKTATDFDTQWAAPSGGGSGGGVYTRATRPAAASLPGNVVYVSDAPLPSYKAQISDGTNWLVVSSGNNADPLTFTYVSNGDANGIVYYLGALATGTFAAPVPNTAGAVSSDGTYLKLDASSVLNASFPLVSVVDRVNGVAWASADAAGSWVRFDFKTRRVRPMRYNLRARNDGTDGSHPRNWVLEGSNDAVAWTILDTHTNDTTLNTVAVWGTFPCTTSVFYQYLRIRNTGVSSSANNFLVLGEIEVYGEMLP